MNLAYLIDSGMSEKMVHQRSYRSILNILFHIHNHLADMTSDVNFKVTHAAVFIHQMVVMELPSGISGKSLMTDLDSGKEMGIEMLKQSR